MEPLGLSKADLFFPLIANSPEESGGSISLQNILDLKDNGMLDALRNLQTSIAHTRGQSGLFDDTLAEDPLLNRFFKFLKAADEVVSARRFVDSGHSLTITREDNSVTALDGENFYLNPLLECFKHIQERYGRRELETMQSDTSNMPVPPVNIERICAMSIWSLSKNHAFEYLRTFKVRPVHGSKELIVEVPKHEGAKWQGSKPGSKPVPESERLLPEGERARRLNEVMEFLMQYCQPGKLGIFDAATVKMVHSENGDTIGVIPTGDNNPGVAALRNVASKQMQEEMASRSFGAQII